MNKGRGERESDEQPAFVYRIAFRCIVQLKPFIATKVNEFASSEQTIFDNNSNRTVLSIRHHEYVHAVTI